MYLEPGNNTLEIKLDSSKGYADFKPFSEDNLSDKLPHSYESYIFEI